MEEGRRGEMITLKQLLIVSKDEPKSEFYRKTLIPLGCWEHEEDTINDYYRQTNIWHEVKEIEE